MTTIDHRSAEVDRRRGLLGVAAVAAAAGPSAAYRAKFMGRYERRLICGGESSAI